MQVDVVIVGGGPVGLSLAAALSRTGLKLAVVESQASRAHDEGQAWDSRVYAISPGAAAFLEACGAWQRVPRERIARVEAMRVYGDDARACLEFSAYDAGLRELAFIVENNRLQHALWQRVREETVAVYCPAGWRSLEFGPDAARIELDDGTMIAARLVVGADGADSRVRERAGIAVKPLEYRQLGVVGNFSCGRPHDGVAYQWFRRDGVLALLPLPGRRASMVWSLEEEGARRLLGLAPGRLGEEVAVASHGALGALASITPPAAFPLRLQRVERFIGSRVALVGDAAHNIHPLAGQGLNLGFRDARELARALAGRGPFEDCGEQTLLRRYERARREDVLAMQYATDGLQKLFNNDVVWLERVRNLGLQLVNGQPQLKNFLVRQAVA
ncbi:MAG: UbiH/UbiF family hydroxylase [Betaproteobacteria bacterium]|nr:UbiH/UbiF family hydroxylase [Betaproteobacteria bacterium]